MRVGWQPRASAQTPELCNRDKAQAQQRLLSEHFHPLLGRTGHTRIDMAQLGRIRSQDRWSMGQLEWCAEVVRVHERE